MEELKEGIRHTDQFLVELKDKKNKQTVNENNRLQFLKEKECDIVKILQNDKIYEQRTQLKENIPSK